MQPEFELKRLTPDDAGRAAELTQLIGWSQDISIWKRLIAWGGESAFCLVHGDQLVATAVSTVYNQRLAWVGVVITHPDYRGQGCAKRLMNVALDDARERGVECVMLDASQLGYPVYQKLGFRDLYRVETWGIEDQVDMGAFRQTPLQYNIRPMLEADLPRVIALDAQHFGFERPQVIRRLWELGSCLVAGIPGHIDGYLMLQSSAVGWRGGPWYHRSADGAEALLLAALAYIDKPPFRVQSPANNPDAIAILERYGFSLSRYTTRMVYGGDPPGQMEQQYGVATLATG
jgi:ribosomal protein S18 acetylase RimI-like enzyme